MPRARLPLVVLLAVALATPAGATRDFVATTRDFVATTRDFKCITRGHKVPGKNFFIRHKKKAVLRKAIRLTEDAIANGTTDFQYPVGTMLQLFPFEAMVKRKAGFNPDGGDWEYFQLAISDTGKTTILSRGKVEVENHFGSCQGCHATLAASHDYVCEYVVGTAGLRLTDQQVADLQAQDRRCAKKKP